MQDDFFPEPAPAGRRRLRLPRPSLAGTGRWAGRLVLAILILIVLYYSLGALIVHDVDDDPAFAAPAEPAGDSRAVAIAAALIGREVDDHEWVANDPFFLPGAVLGLAPAPDLAHLHEKDVCGGVIEKLLGGSPASQPERYEMGSQMSLVPLGVPQILIIGR